MLFNFHTHTNYCDGKNTAEEIIQEAIERGFCSLGFSSHSYTDFDLRYCMKDTEGYIAEINALKEKYKNKIQIYLGTEEDMRGLTDRTRYDYILGASHYWKVGDEYFDVDGFPDTTKDALNAVNGNVEKLVTLYYEPFCEYILTRKPDIVAHFDLLTKFDEKYENIFSCHEKYHKLAEMYLHKVLQSDCIFEINTGAISRGYRKEPYPAPNLLHIMKKNNAKITLSADAHVKENINYYFKETAQMLFDVGFREVYALYDGSFKSFDIKEVF